MQNLTAAEIFTLSFMGSVLAIMVAGAYAYSLLSIHKRGPDRLAVSLFLFANLAIGTGAYALFTTQ